MMQVVHEPQSARPKMAERHSALMRFCRSLGQGREKVGLTYRRVSTPSWRRICSKTARSSEPRALEMSTKATGPWISPLLAASWSLSAAAAPRGSSSSCPSSPASSAPRSSASGRGSTGSVQGSDISAVAMPFFPTPKPGQKAENFPAPPPATTMLKLSGPLNFGSAKKGFPSSAITRAHMVTKSPADLASQTGTPRTCSTCSTAAPTWGRKARQV
mmetsp:Transcript_64482/g.153947  ORF Transcript_64482/g.153947 Transcript_64482/m.153947 type:complete len:216 (-) Transcript_64482:438-1085(-)